MTYCRAHLIPWMEIYRSLINLKAEFCFEYLAATLDQPADLFEETLTSILPDSEQGLIAGLIDSPVLPVHQKMEQMFPSRQKLRYVPGDTPLIKESDTAKMVEKALEELSIPPDQECMICYSLYTPVITMTCTEVLKCCSTLFDPPENVAVIAKNYSWIIFRNLEEKWIWFNRADV